VTCVRGGTEKQALGVLGYATTVEGQTGAQFEIAITFCKRKSGSQKGAGY